VDIPITSSVLGTVKVGDVTYNGAQAQKLSDAAQRLDVARLGNCSIMFSPGFGTMSESYRASIYDKVAESNRLMIEYGRALGDAKNSTEGQKAADEALKQATTVVPPSTPAPPATPVPSSSIDPVAREAALNVKLRVDELKLAVGELSSGFKQLRESGPIRLQVLGFALDSSALHADRRQVLSTDFRAALESIPPGRTPNVLLIGYADGKGAKVYNVSLALRRAEAVEEFLRSQNFHRPFHTDVTSGGVFVRGSSTEARRVDILVSRASVLVTAA
jgi:outer membrane protein OmpA-like peptidoglycan-associated protein